MRTLQHLPLILSAVFLNAIAQLCLKAGMLRIGDFTFSVSHMLPFGWAVIKNPFIDLGLLCYGISLVLWLVTLSKVDVSVAYPMLSLGYVISCIAGYYWFHEPITLMRILGVGIIMLGVYLVARS